jgi:cation/acetate symporter
LSGALGGPILLGFISAVAFATILAVVAGLTLAGASAVSHDLYGQVIARGKAPEGHEVLVAKIAAIGIGITAVALAYAFENQNVAFMAGLALSVAASCNFPVLAMAIFWRGTTTRGAVVGGLVGLISSILLVVLSKTVWVAVFHFAAPLFPYDNPALFSMPLAFITIWLGSMSDKTRRAVAERHAFDAQFVQSETGIKNLEVSAGATT